MSLCVQTYCAHDSPENTAVVGEWMALDSLHPRLKELLLNFCSIEVDRKPESLLKTNVHNNVTQSQTQSTITIVHSHVISKGNKISA